MYKRLLSLLFIIGLLAQGCFSTRPVEPPENPLSGWITPINHTILLENFRTAIAESNTANYKRCFVQDSFVFSPLGALFNSHEAIWRNWSLNDEQTWFNNLKNSAVGTGGNNLTLSNPLIQNQSSDSLTYSADYTLTVNHNDTTLTKVFNGQLQFSFYLNSSKNEWEIKRWNDLSAIPEVSWSQLKIAFIQ